MKLLRNHPVLFVPLGLLAAFLIFPFLGRSSKHQAEQLQSPTVAGETTGFLDYDLLPEALKQQMEELVQQDSINQYGFYYFFDIDDINHRYYLTDNERNEIVVDQAVISEHAFSLVEEKLLRDQPKGLSVSFDTSYFNRQSVGREDFVKAQVLYILPEGEVDFRQLRVGIVREKIPLALSNIFKTTTCHLRDVSVAPQPIRGIKYFHEVLQKRLRDDLVYYQLYNLQGTVKAEFTIGGKAASPQVVEGFSTRQDSYEAYRLDGLVVKALNEPKVHWHYARYNDQLVNVRVGMDFQFAFDDQGTLTLTLSDLYPAITR